MSRKRISICSQLPPASFIDIIKNNTEVFSAFRVHRMQKDIAALMVGDDGKLKQFSQFAKDVKPYVSHQNRVWLETEYNTAVHRAQLASEWQQFERDADVFPNLRWVPTTSPNIGEDHRVFWNVIRPVKDSFWSVHRPGDRWNCKCSLEQTDKDITPVPNGTIEKGSTPSRGLDNNPGKDGKLFNEKHPYFPKNCSACPFKSANLSALFHSLADKKNCNACKNVSKAIYKTKPQLNRVPPLVEEYKKINKNVYVSTLHGNLELDQNIKIAKRIARALNTRIYLLPRIERNQINTKIMRLKYLPRGIKDNKCPDFMINGKIFEAKAMINFNGNPNSRKDVKQSIENHIKKAKEQADNIILDIPEYIPYSYIKDTVINYLSLTKHNREIWIVYGKKLRRYKSRRVN